jgi:hypothetical protein
MSARPHPADLRTSGPVINAPPFRERKGRGRICLVTSQHLYENPRLVKEADALTEAGFSVRVVACRRHEWISRMDDQLLATRSWRCDFVDWTRQTHPVKFWSSRCRQHLAMRAARWIGGSTRIKARAIGRVVPEMEKLAAAEPADLIIGHNIPALPAAVGAARRLGCAAGFDAEDSHADMWLHCNGPRLADRLAESLERKLLPACRHLTSASPLIAEAYRQRYGVNNMVTILNVFPLSMRPATHPPTRPDGPLRLYWFSQTIGRNRGLEDIVEAMGQVKDIPIELNLRGNWQPGYREELHALAASRLLPADCIKHFTPAPPDEMSRLSAEFDVGLAVEPGCSTNNSIALSNKIFTYLLAGNAIAATATPAQSQLCHQLGAAAFSFLPGDSTALGAQFRLWHADRAALDTARRCAWDLGGQRYHWDVEKEKLVRAVGAVLV